MKALKRNEMNEKRRKNAFFVRLFVLAAVLLFASGSVRDVRAAELPGKSTAVEAPAGLTAALTAEPASTPAETADFILDDRAVINGMGKSWYQGYEPAIASDNMALYLPVRSEAASGAVTASLRLSDPDLYLFRSAPAEVKVDSVSGIYGIKLTLPLQKNRVNGDFPAMISVSGQDAEGNELKTEFPYVIRIRGGQANREKHSPEIALSGELTVGEEGSLTLSLRNPSTTVSLTDAEAVLTEESGSVTVCGKSSIRLPEILPGKETSVDIPVLVSGNCAVTPHRFIVQLSYEALGQAESPEESFLLPVTQEIRLEQGSLEFPPTAVEGEIASFSLNLMNLGKAEIRNAMVSLDMEGLVSKQSVLAGTIYPGESKQARLSFTPVKGAPGLKHGTVSVYCEDAYGNVRENSFPVELTVEKAPEKAAPDDLEEKKEAPAWLLPVLGAGCAVFFAAFIIQGAVLRNRLHKLEEERL